MFRMPWRIKIILFVLPEEFFFHKDVVVEVDVVDLKAPYVRRHQRECACKLYSFHCTYSVFLDVFKKDNVLPPLRTSCTGSII